MAKNIFQERITPEKPKALAQERVYVYVPKTSIDENGNSTAGIASFDSEQFVVNAGKVNLHPDIVEEIEKGGEAGERLDTLEARVDGIDGTIDDINNKVNSLEDELDNKVDKAITNDNTIGKVTNNTNETSISRKVTQRETTSEGRVGVSTGDVHIQAENSFRNPVTGDITHNETNLDITPTSATLNQKQIAVVDDIEESAEELRQSIQAVDNKLGDCTEEDPAANKAFVNSTIQTATANFRGNWEDFASVPADAEEYPLDFAQSRTPTVNDYIAIADASDYHSEEIFTRDGETTGYYISANGTITANGDFAYSDELELDNKDKALTLRATGISGRIFRIHCYDENHNWLQEVVSGQSTGELVLYGTLPEEAKYVRVSYPQAAADGIELYTHLTLGSWRFKYTGNWDIQGKAGWEPEYQLNETPFTMAQLATLNSGLTADDKLIVATSSRLGGLYFWIDDDGIPNISTTPRPAFINEQINGEVIMRGAFEATQTDSTVILG